MLPDGPATNADDELASTKFWKQAIDTLHNQLHFGTMCGWGRLYGAPKPTGGGEGEGVDMERSEVRKEGRPKHRSEICAQRPHIVRQSPRDAGQPHCGHMPLPRRPLSGAMRRAPNGMQMWRSRHVALPPCGRLGSAPTPRPPKERSLPRDAPQSLCVSRRSARTRTPDVLEASPSAHEVSRSSRETRSPPSRSERRSAPTALEQLQARGDPDHTTKQKHIPNRNGRSGITEGPPPLFARQPMLSVPSPSKFVQIRTLSANVDAKFRTTLAMPGPAEWPKMTERISSPKVTKKLLDTSPEKIPPAMTGVAQTLPFNCV